MVIRNECALSWVSKFKHHLIISAIYLRYPNLLAIFLFTIFLLKDNLVERWLQLLVGIITSAKQGNRKQSISSICRYNMISGGASDWLMRRIISYLPWLNSKLAEENRKWETPSMISICAHSAPLVLMCRPLIWFDIDLNLDWKHFINYT